MAEFLPFRLPDDVVVAPGDRPKAMKSGNGMCVYKNFFDIRQHAFIDEFLADLRQMEAFDRHPTLRNLSDEALGSRWLESSMPTPIGPFVAVGKMEVPPLPVELANAPHWRTNWELAPELLQMMGAIFCRVRGDACQLLAAVQHPNAERYPVMDKILSKIIKVQTETQEWEVLHALVDPNDLHTRALLGVHQFKPRRDYVFKKNGAYLSMVRRLSKQPSTRAS